MSVGMVGALVQSMAPALLARLADIAAEKGGLDELAREASGQILELVRDRSSQEQLAQLVGLIAGRLQAQLYPTIAPGYRGPSLGSRSRHNECDAVGT